MHRSFACIWLVSLAVVRPTRAAEPVHYLKDVKPILTARCYSCHGALQQKGDLRTDTAQALREAKAVVPGKSDESPLIAHLLGREGLERMPPESDGEALSTAQIMTLRRWIDEGAQAPPKEQPDPDPREHWAFRAPVRPPLPSLPDSTPKFRNPIDQFLAAERAKHKLTPQPAADRRLVLRRVYLDLIGLPPTAAQTEAFLKDASLDAFEKVVDQLLASPQYGERWGRHFLDVWRYSDWWGLGAQVRNSQKHMWHWRDWVVKSVNDDTGYDEMIRQMLAADELYPTDPDKLRATGFLARQYFLFNRTTWMDETIEHTGKAFLGLTFNCSKCHDHKYDPIRQVDYYRMRAFFEPYQVRLDMVPGEPDFEKDGIPRAFDCHAEEPTYKHERGDEKRAVTSIVIKPGVPPLLAFGELKIEPVKLPMEAHSPQLQPFVREAYLKSVKKDGEAMRRVIEARAEADRLKVTGPPEKFKEAAAQAAKYEKALAVSQAEDALQKAQEALGKADAKTKAALAKKRDTAQTALAAAKKAAEKPGEAYTSLRGALKSLEAPTETEAGRAKPFPTTSTGRRTALAKWIADARNPLTARVLVNHVWARHFGRPLVPSVFDLGRKGAKPTHPELLDWLAAEFTEHNWSVKHLHRLIVTSQAYRMTSSVESNPTGNPNPDFRTPHSIDPENQYLWRQNPIRMESQVVRDGLLHLAGKLDLTVGGPSIPFAQQEASVRRSLYFFQSHNEHSKFLSQFDDANVLECYRRTESIVPQQALTLANSKFALTMIDAIAGKLHKQVGTAGDEAFVTAAFEMVLGCSPTEAERTACREALAEWFTDLKTQKHPDPAGKARINLVGALVNHNDFVTVR